MEPGREGIGGKGGKGTAATKGSRLAGLISRGIISHTAKPHSEAKKSKSNS